MQRSGFIELDHCEWNGPFDGSHVPRQCLLHRGLRQDDYGDRGGDRFEPGRPSFLGLLLLTSSR